MKAIRKLGGKNCFYTCRVHDSDLADFACALLLKIVWLIVFYNALVGLSVCVTNIMVCIKQTTFEMLNHELLIDDIRFLFSNYQLSLIINLAVFVISAFVLRCI